MILGELWKLHWLWQKKKWKLHCFLKFYLKPYDLDFDIFFNYQLYQKTFKITTNLLKSTI